jgi:battenin
VCLPSNPVSSSLTSRFPGLINNVLYVIILSSALDLVGPSLPKSLILLFDVIPSFLTKLFAPSLNIHLVPYPLRILAITLLSTIGMLLVALSPSYLEGDTPGVPQGTATKMIGIVLASLASGLGELSFLGMTHWYGEWSLAAWGSGTGAAGLVGAGAYAVMTTAWGISVRTTLLSSAGLPIIMLASFFIVLPVEKLRSGKSSAREGYREVTSEETVAGDEDTVPEDAGLLERVGSASQARSPSHNNDSWLSSIKHNFSRSKALFFP